VLAGTDLGWLAAAGKRDARWLGEEVLAWSARRLPAQIRAHRLERDRATTAAQRKRVRNGTAAALAFWEEQTLARLDSVGRALGAAVGELKRAASRTARKRAKELSVKLRRPAVGKRDVIPVRLHAGVPAMDGRADLHRRISQATGDTFPWSTFLVSALFWADGKRTTGEIAARLHQEFGRGDPKAIRKLFEILSDGGYVVLRKKW